LPLSEADMKEAKRNLRRLSGADQLLSRLLASTGMRLSEAFEIEDELKERGCRYVIVGKKTEQSERRVPLPASVLPFLPGIIKGSLFDNNAPQPRNASIGSSTEANKGGCSKRRPDNHQR
jgi:integrase